MPEPTVSFPKELVNNVLGLEDPANPRVLGEHTERSTYDPDGWRHPEVTIELTMEQVGQLFQWAWSDASDFMDGELTEGSTRLQYALDHRTSRAETLRNLIMHCAKAMGMAELPDTREAKAKVRQLANELLRLADS